MSGCIYRFLCVGKLLWNEQHPPNSWSVIWLTLVSSSLICSEAIALKFVTALESTVGFVSRQLFDPIQSWCGQQLVWKCQFLRRSRISDNEDNVSERKWSVGGWVGVWRGRGGVASLISFHLQNKHCKALSIQVFLPPCAVYQQLQQSYLYSYRQECLLCLHTKAEDGFLESRFKQFL